jgi:hypothetical protein
LAIGLPRYRTPTDLLVLFTIALGTLIWKEVSAAPAESSVSNTGFERVRAE